MKFCSSQATEISTREAQILKKLETSIYRSFQKYQCEKHTGHIKQVKIDESKCKHFGEVLDWFFGITFTWPLLDSINIKMSENEMFKAISEIDPENDGYIKYNLFKDKI